MLLAIDIGNTNVVAAVFDGEEIVTQWRVATDVRRTGDEYSSILLTLSRDAGIDLKKVKKAIVSSVVPALIGPFVTVAQHLTGVKPYVMRSSLAFNEIIPVNLPKSSTREMGTDLICNAVSAWKLFGGKPNVVVDFGTALTLTVTDQNGIIQGVTISPGLGTAIKSLATNTAQLPYVPLEAPSSILAATTKEAIQAGVVFGYKGLVECLVSGVKKELCERCGCSEGEIQVVATGGLNSVLKPLTDAFSTVDKDLTVRGLKYISDLVQ